MARARGPRVVAATRSESKLRELRGLLVGWELEPLPGDVQLPPETGTTFAQNALVKARVAATATGLPALADDSGIEAAALGGAPGVWSARFAGEGASDERNLARLLDELRGAVDRRVVYVCALAYVEPGGREHVVHGHCEGVLADAPRGQGGFGYDPAFVPDDRDDGRTMAELSVAEKDAISHRGQAARALAHWLREQAGPAVDASGRERRRRARSAPREAP